MSLLFCFGLGYAAGFVAHEARDQDYAVFGTHRAEKHSIFSTSLFSEGADLDIVGLNVLRHADAVLVSIPPNEKGDVVLPRYLELLKNSPYLKWVGFFSTIGVYGDCQGEWVDETSTIHPQSSRAKNRALAEKQWLDSGLPVHIFRMSAIYGPGRSALEKAREYAPLVHKPDHVFNRIHALDIAQAVMASIQNPTPGAIYNLSDDMPAPGDEVLRYAYELQGLKAPEVTPWEQAILTPTARSFYEENKRARNDKIKSDLNLQWRFPDYKAGLEAEYALLTQARRA